MSYVINGVNDSASGFLNGVRQFTAQVDVQASLSDIDWFPPGSYAIDNAMNIYPKDPKTGNWVLPAATPILITVQPSDITVTEADIDETVSLICYAQDSTQDYTCTYQWYSCDSDGSNPSEVSGQTTATLTIPTDIVNSSSPYYYYCTITANGNTLNSSIITVTVKEAAA